MIETNIKKSCSNSRNFLEVKANMMTTSAAPNIAAYIIVTPNNRFNAMTVPRYSARSVAAAATSELNQYGMTNNLLPNFSRKISAKLFSVAIPNFPDKYCINIAIAQESHTTQSKE